jgi:hypothetical protein
LGRQFPACHALVSNEAKEKYSMPPKVILSKLLRWFADNLLRTILSLIVAALIATWGGVFAFSTSALDYAVQLLNARTPFWATIALILLCVLYTYLKTRRRNPQKPPNVEEELYEAFGVYWNSQYKLRCLRCKWPLKCASKGHDPSIFWCSNCNTKFALRDPNGSALTEANAISGLKELRAIGSTGPAILKSTEKKAVTEITQQTVRTDSDFYIPKQSKTKAPIAWNFNDHFLGMAMQKEGESKVWKISNFHIDGKNISADPITKINGYLRNDITGEKYRLKLNKKGSPVDFSEMLALPPTEKIAIHAFFGDLGNIQDYSVYKGIELTTFLEKFIPFTLFVFINEKEYKYSFSKEQIESVINKHIEACRPKRKEGPVYKNE